MSKFLDSLEKISVSAPAPLGFGVRREQRPPGMALIVQISSDHASGCAGISDLSPEAVLLSGIDDLAALKKIAPGLPSIPWGISPVTVTEDSVNGFKEAGCDMLAFGLADTPVSAINSDEMARVLCLDPSADERQLRAINPLPVDVVLIDVTSQSGTWTLGDLTNITAISSRVNKYILVSISEPPGAKDLKVLRDAGVHGLVVDAGSVSMDSLSKLKSDLQEMPRPQPGRKGRTAAVLPSSVFAVDRAPAPEEPDEDDDDE
ncbi:MAG: hypothetical protein MK128_02765 [Dehalococcoidia bacterium]|jgi:hypothetical protein|nr:hypothetical protein [Dehalococcoidia bacterium]HIB10832.1 hypothetical protein [Dehalococcoidia bacterium]